MLMRVLLISGFLGSGKTSALLKLCAYLVKRENRSGTSVMIIENEIGDVGVDDKVIKMQGLSVKELFAGCACCTSGGDLLTEIRDIRESIDPSWLIIEATDLHIPFRLRKWFQTALSWRLRYSPLRMPPDGRDCAAICPIL
jgi:G3E family GTPase